MVPWVAPMVWMYLFGVERRHHDLTKSKHDDMEMSSSGKNYISFQDSRTQTRQAKQTQFEHFVLQFIPLYFLSELEKGD